MSTFVQSIEQAPGGVRKAKTIAVLRDSGDSDDQLEVTVRVDEHFVEIALAGYGEHSAPDGKGSPILLEVYDGVPTLYVFGDINSEEPTHKIPLSGAAESRRKAEPDE